MIILAFSFTLDSRNVSAFALLTVDLPLFISIANVLNPNVMLARITSVIPLLSPLALIIRLVHGDVPWWEIPAAFTILDVSIHYMAHEARPAFFQPVC